MRATQSVTQRLEDYCLVLGLGLGLRLQNMDIPSFHLVKAHHVDASSPMMLEAVENYLPIKGNDDRIFLRTAQHNGNYIAKLLGNRPITSYSTSEAAQFRDWRLDKDLHCKRLLFDINHATSNSIDLRFHNRIGISNVNLHVFLSVISPLAFVVFCGAWFID